MPVTWNAEAEAKLLVGILDQFKGTNLRLNYDALATYMGPECSVAAVRQHINGLRRTVGGASTPGDTPSTPTNTPRKTKKVQSPETPIKRAKAIHHDQEHIEVKDEECKEEKILTKKEKEKKMDVAFVDLLE